MYSRNYITGIVKYAAVALLVLSGLAACCGGDPAVSGSGVYDPNDLSPVVKLQAYWAEGNLNRTIDAQSSWAKTGKKLKYDYDMNDDGAFEIGGGVPVFTHHFPAKGSFRIWLRVTDESGNSGTTSIVVEV